MFFAGFDLLFSILFPILFLVVLGMILYAIIGNIRTWNKNILPLQNFFQQSLYVLQKGFLSKGVHFEEHRLAAACGDGG